MELHKLWEAVLARVELELSPANFSTWFKNTQAVEKSKDTLVVGVPNSFVKEWLQTKYAKNLLNIVREVDNKIRRLEFVVIKISQQTGFSAKRKTLTEFDRQKIANLNPRYTFKNFVVGSFNELAHAASLAVTENPGSVYNPLFVYGKVGLGKTHLLQAIGNEILQKTQDLRVKYMSAETLTSQIVQAIRNQNIESLKRDYIQYDVLIIDDVQFLSGKEKTQEEFFHLFNTLYQKNKQIVLSSDRPPRAIPALAERLRSRFEGGMIADISYPEFESRIAILKRKLEEKNHHIKDEVIEFIAKTVQTNIRELEGALNRVLLTQKLKQKELSLKEVKDLLKEISIPSNKKLSPKNLIKAVADFYDLKEKDILSSSRKREIVKPRQIAMYLLKENFGCSYPFIAKLFGGKDHTTAIYAVEKIKKQLEHDEHLFQELEVIKIRLTEGE